MNLADLKPGRLYTLTQDVKNPACDRRSANKLLSRVVFDEGMFFKCRTDEHVPSLRNLLLPNQEYRGFTAAIHRESGVEYPKRGRDAEWAKALVPHLKEIPIDSWDTMRLAYGRSTDTSVLKELVQDGTVPLERVIEMVRRRAHGATDPSEETS